MRHLSDLLPFCRKAAPGHAVGRSERPEPPGSGAEFQAWEAQRLALERQLDATREGVDDEKREQLFGAISDLEQLILSTPSLDLRALSVKARLLSWYMEMEQADGAPALRHIREFLESRT